MIDNSVNSSLIFHETHNQRFISLYGGPKLKVISKLIPALYEILHVVNKLIARVKLAIFYTSSIRYWVQLDKIACHYVCCTS